MIEKELEQIEEDLIELGFKYDPKQLVYWKAASSGKVVHVDINPHSLSMKVMSETGEALSDVVTEKIIMENPVLLDLKYRIERLKTKMVLEGGDMAIPGSCSSQDHGHNMSTDPAELCVKGDIVMPVVPVEMARDAFRQYLQLCEAILEPSDYQDYDGTKRKKTSAWLKLSRVYNLTEAAPKITLERAYDNSIESAWCEVQLIAPNGRVAYGMGFCSIRDRAHDDPKYKDGKIVCPGPCDGRKHFTKPEHTIPTTAHTRARNRAIRAMIAASDEPLEDE